jgi:DNA-directed RNA polymerase subunit K/omega
MEEELFLDDDGDDFFPDEDAVEVEIEDTDNEDETPSGTTTSKYLKEKKTPPIMNSFEKNCYIAKRVIQLNNGFKSTIEDVIEKEGIHKSHEIAVREFELNRTPKYYIKRNLPNGYYELWSHEDFEFFPN